MVATPSKEGVVALTNISREINEKKKRLSKVVGWAMVFIDWAAPLELDG
jgi:hypothetical protein